MKILEEIIFLSKRKVLRVKRKKIVENSKKNSTTNTNTATTTNISPENDFSCSSPSNSSKQSAKVDLPLQETVFSGIPDTRIPITFSWPSLEVCVHNQEEILDLRPDQVNVNIGLKNNLDRIKIAENRYNQQGWSLLTDLLKANRL